jgi:hypothetical protein
MNSRYNPLTGKLDMVGTVIDVLFSQDNLNAVYNPAGGALTTVMTVDIPAGWLKKVGNKVQGFVTGSISNGTTGRELSITLDPDSAGVTVFDYQFPNGSNGGGDFILEFDIEKVQNSQNLSSTTELRITSKFMSVTPDSVANQAYVNNNEFDSLDVVLPVAFQAAGLLAGYVVFTSITMKAIRI